MRISKTNSSSTAAAVIGCCLAISLLSQGFKTASAGEPLSREPFSPLIGKNGLILIPREIDITGLNLRGIIYSETAPLAVINGEILGLGDTIAGYKVLRIDERGVTLQKGDGNEGFTLKLEEE